MTWCSHRKGVNEGLSAAAALPAAIKADVRLSSSAHLPAPLPPPFLSVRLVLLGVRQENTAGGAGWGVMCVCVCVCVCVWRLSYLVGETPDLLCHPSCYRRAVRFIRMCLPRPVPLT